MRRWIFLIAAVGYAFLPTAVFADSALPYVEPGECPIEVPLDGNVECGYLVVPENYADPDGKQIRLPYIILHSNDTGPGQTPLLFTEGGPGGTSLQSVWGFKDSVLLRDRDLIILEQRGSLYSEPALKCTFEELYDEQENRSPCKDKFTSAGIDLTQYHTVVLAEDIESLRIALKIDQWNLFGTSYSTRLMQVLMVRYPEGIRSVILQSVSPLSQTRYQHDPEHSYYALQVMFEDCAANPGCRDAYPDLEERFFTLVADLNQTPIELTVESPQDGSQYPYKISGKTIIDWMVGRAFYGPAHPPFTTAYYPLLIDQLSAGKTEMLVPWVQNELRNEIFASDFIAFGLYFAVNCQDDAGSVTLDEIESQSAVYSAMDGYYRHREEWQLCQIWDLPAAAPLAEQPINSDIPALVLAGTYDPITPPKWSRMVADNLEHAFYVEFPSKGHSLDIGSSCAEEIKRTFLREPLKKPVTTCLGDEPQPTFVLRSEVVSMPGFTQSVNDIDFGNPDRGVPLLETVSAISLFIYLSSIVYSIVLVGQLVARATKRQPSVRSMNFYPHLLAGTIGLFGIGSVILISMINQSDLNIDKTLQYFEFVAAAPEVIALGVVVIAHILVGIVLLVWCAFTLIKARGSILSRFFLVLSSLATVAFWPFYFRWGLVTIVFSKIFL